ncbi:MAG: hypothetical protein HY080_14795 [Gammaproteobacteria bacterium]|nr:hypothetical protein [Gammaproteobacteria bacterium]
MEGFFDSSRFLPHGHCYLWRPDILWVHIMSDSVIFAAYIAIPLALIYVVRKRTDLPFPTVFYLFSLFIIFCGTTHLINVWTIWQPYYGIAGVVKAFTAALSLITAYIVWNITPEALGIPDRQALQTANDNWKKLSHSLEGEIEARTQKLEERNQALQKFNEAALDREDRIIELKNEVNELCRRLHTLPKYDLSKIQAL